MDFKLDENLPPEAAAYLRSNLHDAMTVGQQQLSGAVDEDLLNICDLEKRVFLTCDRDFMNTGRYPPAKHCGIVVFRLKVQSRKSILAAIARILPVMEDSDMNGHLWIVGDSGRRLR